MMLWVCNQSQTALEQRRTLSSHGDRVFSLYVQRTRWNQSECRSCVVDDSPAHRWI